ncbi:MAG: hypothetical protein PF518_14540 [Spirochaetaceae bacterium]|jgi:hypothetical protein|nr:hypothetical protein [Spirochaetaceae bacterium]
MEYIRELYYHPAEYDEVTAEFDTMTYCNLGQLAGKVRFLFFNMNHGGPSHIPDDYLPNRREILYKVTHNDFFSGHYLVTNAEYMYDYDGTLLFCLVEAQDVLYNAGWLREYFFKTLDMFFMDSEYRIY